MAKPTSSFSLLLIFSLLAVDASSGTLSGQSDGGDILIRQVVDENGEVRLGAEHHFSLFKSRFGKKYSSQEEHDYRFAVFKANLRRARRHQRLDPSASHGVTRFSDLTPAEFRRNFLGLRRKLRLPSDANKASILPTDNIPEDFDWRDHGAVTPVKNQVLSICICVYILFIYVCFWLIDFDDFFFFNNTLGVFWYEKTSFFSEKY